MAIVARELDAAASGTNEVGHKVGRVIESYRPRICEIRAQRRKFRMPRERDDAANKMRSASARCQIRVTLHAGSIAHGGEPHAPLMLHVT